MKTKPTGSKRGRKQFSAGKLISPDNTLDENINLAAIGECAANPKLREAFHIVSLWKKYHARPAHVPRQAAKFVSQLVRRRARSHEEKLLVLLQDSLADSRSAFLSLRSIGNRSRDMDTSQQARAGTYWFDASLT